MAKRLSVLDAERCVGCQVCMFACSRRFGVAGLEGSAIWVKSAGGIRKGFAVVVCRACDNPPCVKVCPTDALTMKEGGGAKLHPELCVGCHNCENACPFGAILWNEKQNKPHLCVYCGYCADYCPCDVLALEEIHRDTNELAVNSQPESDGGHAQ